MPTTRPRATLLVVSAAAFLVSLDLFIVNIAFPDMRADFPGSDLAGLSWILTGYTVVFAAFLALAGRLGDRSGHRRVFLVGLAVFTVASVACAAGPSVGAIVAARVLQAVGAALVVPTSLSLLLAAFPPEARTRAVAAWASIGAVAAALGPPLGGLLTAVSWHWVFLVNVPVGVVALVAGRRVLPRPAPATTAPAGRPDVVGAVGLVLGVGAAAWSLVRAPESGWASTAVLGGLAVAVVTLAAVVHRSRSHPVPALDLAVLRVPAIALASTAMLLFAAAFAGMLVVNVLFLTGTWHYSAPRAGFALMAGPAVVVGVARLTGRLVPRVGVGALAGLGAVSFAGGVTTWLLGLDVSPAYATGMLPGQLLTGLGVGLILPSLSSTVGSALSAPQWGSGSSLINTARQMGAVLGVAVLVSVVGAATTGAPADLPLLRHGWAALAALAAGSALVSAALAVRERRARPGPGADPTAEPAGPGEPARTPAPAPTATGEPA